MIQRDRVSYQDKGNPHHTCRTMLKTQEV